MTRGYGSRRYASRRTSSPTCRLVKRVSRTGSPRLSSTTRPGARERRRDEEEQLVDEACFQERPGKRRASLEQQRLDALGGERAQLVLERAGAQLELGAVRQRAAAEGQPPRLALRVDVARVESRILEAHRSHADGDCVGRGAQLVDATARCLPRDPALARHGDPPVERHRRLVGDERPAERDPRSPRLVLAPRLEAVGVLDLDAARAEPLEPALRLGVRVERPGDDARDPRREHGVDARRRRAVVGARLHRHEEGRAAGALAGGFERHDLAVTAGLLGRTLADDLAVRDDHRADRRLRIGPAVRTLAASSSARSKLMRVLVPAVCRPAADPRARRSRSRRSSDPLRPRAPCGRCPG